MVAQIIDGRSYSKELTAQYADAVEKLKAKGITPKLVVVTVGNDEASIIYDEQKRKRCNKIGMDFEAFYLDKDITQEELNAKIRELNEDDSVSGIFVSAPLPGDLSHQEVSRVIDPDKDVDGFSPVNLGKIVAGSGQLFPCTPRGVMKLLKHYNVELKGKDIAVIGKSPEVGLPLSILLMNEDATVTPCHLSTKDTNSYVRNADIVISAAGVPDLVHGDNLKEGVVVVDVGINRLEDGSIVGDVNYDSAAEKASLITPVPGGVGPMTVAMLLEQTIECACIHNGLKLEDVLEDA